MTIQDKSKLIKKLLEDAKTIALKTGAHKVIEVEIEGTMPLLQDKLPDEFFIEAHEMSRRTTGVKPNLDYTKSIYYDKNDLICEPANHIEASIIQASGEFKIKGQARKSYRRAFESFVFVVPDMIPHLKQEVEKLTCVVPANGTSGGRRPKIYPKLETGWILKFYLLIKDEQIPALTVKEVLEHAGKMFGIGAWRKRYGRFTLVSWREIK